MGINMSNKEHPQAEILRAIADGKTIEGKHLDGQWVPHPSPWLRIGDLSWQLRIKSETIALAGHEFPSPVREPLKTGTPYWQVTAGSNNLCTQWRWNGDHSDMTLLKRRLIQLTEEGAIAQARAMIASVGGEV